MTLSLPANVGYGYITGQILFAVGDTVSDPDDLPEAVAPAGTVTFTPAPVLFINPTQQLIILPRPIVVYLDANGEFIVSLLATNDTDFAAVSWTYEVSFQIGVEVVPFNILCPEGETHDLSEYAITESSAGVVTMFGQAGPSAYQLAVTNGFVGTLTAWLESIRGPAGSSAVQGGFTAPTVSNNVATVNIASNWGINAGVGYYNSAGAVTAEAAIATLLSDGYPGLRRIGDADTTIAEEHGAWSSATAYRHGEVVTYLGARWFAKVANTNSAPSRTNVNWVHLGLYAIVSSTDPGGGMGWLNPT